jgi:hypothetical protein
MVTAVLGVFSVGLTSMASAAASSPLSANLAISGGTACAATPCAQAFPAFTGYGQLNADYSSALAFANGNLNGTSGGVVVAETDGTDEVFLPTGSGGYTQMPSLSFNTDGISQFTAAAVAIGDVNGDGKSDLVEVAYGQAPGGQCNSPGPYPGGCDLLIVALGNGDGTFQTPTVTPISWESYTGDSGNPGSVPASDLCVNRNWGYVNYPGEFVPQVQSIALGDLNNDGHLDLVVGYNGVHNSYLGWGSNGSTGAVGVLQGNGDGTFTAQTQTSNGGDVADGCYGAVLQGPAPTNITEVAVADLGGDGKADVVASNGFNPGGGGGGVTIWNGNGDGTLAAGTDPYAISGQSVGLAVADMNGDGHPDLVVPDTADSLIYVLDGSTGFTSVIGTPVSTPRNYPSWPVVADFDSNGTPDVAVAEPGYWGTLVFNDGSGNLLNPQEIEAHVGNEGQGGSGSGRDLLTADVDGNGTPDLLALGSWAAPQLMVGLSQLPPSQIAQTITFTSSPPFSPAYGGSYSVAATGGGSGNPVTFTVDSSSGGNCSISGATVSFTGVGPCVIDANQAGGGSYAAAAQVQQSFMIGQASQTITFTSAPPSPSLVGGTYTPTATGGASGAPVVFGIDSSSGAGVCTISSGKVSFTGVGTCIVDANQTGTADYAPAAQQQQSIAVARPPKVTAVSPAAGPTTGGTTVTITGANFTPAAAVHFGTAASTSVTFVSATQLTAIAPPHAVAAVNVTVTTAGGTSAISAADRYAYDAVPTLTSISPASGPISGGNTVTISGTQFVAGATVQFGSSAPIAATNVAATQLTAVAPAGSAGDVNVTVTTPGGTSATSTKTLYAYGAPGVSAFIPSSGPTGITVRITGNSFSPGAIVSFGSLASPTVAISSATQLTAVVPNGAVSAPISVSDNGGTATTATPFTVTLAVTGFSPASGPTGTLVTITGIGFNSSSVVHFGRIAASSTTFVSSTELQAIVPATTATEPISVTNTKAPAGTVQSAQFYNAQ